MQEQSCGSFFVTDDAGERVARAQHTPPTRSRLGQVTQKTIAKVGRTMLLLLRRMYVDVIRQVANALFVLEDVYTCVPFRQLLSSFPCGQL